MNREFQAKKTILKDYLNRSGFDGILLSMKDNEAWLTCGGSCWVGKDSQQGAVDLLYVDGRFILITAQNEADRVSDEELANLGFEVAIYPWYESKLSTFREYTKGKKIVSDTGYDGTENRYQEIVRLRYAMQPEEIERARKLGSDCAKAMFETCNEINPGDTEHEAAARITGKLMAMGIEAPCCLIASDERILKYRHPIPTFKKIDKLCMVVICGVRHGLVMSLSRLVSFGPISEDLKKRHLACCKVATEFIQKTVIGKNVSEVFRDGIEAYKTVGYPEDWKLHHQGGSIGYDGRDYCCNFNISEIIVENQMFAWNPTITGTKVEDTFIITRNGPEILSEIPGWPVIEVTTPLGTVRCPDILIR